MIQGSVEVLTMLGQVESDRVCQHNSFHPLHVPVCQHDPRSVLRIQGSRQR